jgi:hypothetical protein
VRSVNVRRFPWFSGKALAAGCRASIAWRARRALGGARANRALLRRRRRLRSDGDAAGIQDGLDQLTGTMRGAVMMSPSASRSVPPLPADRRVLAGAMSDPANLADGTSSHDAARNACSLTSKSQSATSIMTAPPASLSYRAACAQ